MFRSILMLRKWFASPASVRKPIKPRFRPTLEWLEDRIVPAPAPPITNLVVTNTSSDPSVVGSLPYEMSQVQNGQNIVFDPSLNNQTITLNSEISLGQNGTTNVSILGQDKNGNPLNVTISGGNITRLFEVLPGVSGTINNLSLINGYTWLNSQENGSGAAVLVDENAVLNLSGDTFSGNEATNESLEASGGALANLGTVNILGSTTFAKNSAQVNGGAIDNLGVLNIPGTAGWVDFNGNSASQNGGAIYSNSSGTGSVNIVKASFENNTAQGGNGGAIDTWDNATITNDTFVGNEASANGGAITNEDESELDVPPTTLDVTDSAFQGNSAGQNGGAIENFAKLNVLLVNGNPSFYNGVSMFAGNIAQGNGGAIDSNAENANVPGGSLTVSSSNTLLPISFDGNQVVSGSGGAINTADNTVLNNDWFGIYAANTAIHAGGAVNAIGNNGYTTLNVANSHFYNNYVSDTLFGEGNAISTSAITDVETSSFKDNGLATALRGVTGGAIAYDINNVSSPTTPYNSSLTVNQDYFEDNYANLGGGICTVVRVNSGLITVNVTASTFYRNVAVVGGGVDIQDEIDEGDGSVTTGLSNDTFFQNVASNAATGSGGGISLLLTNGMGSMGANTATLTSLTVYDNDAWNKGGGISIVADGAQSVAVDNSIIDGNTVAAPGFIGPQNVFLGAAVSLNDLGYNLVGTLDTMFTTETNYWNNFPGLPNALALNNALPGYQMTLALQAGSPALGKGNPLRAGTIDERGYTRQKGTVSIGAEDPNAKLPAAMSLNSSVNPAVAGQPITFTAAITIVGGIQPTGDVTFLDGNTVLGTASFDSNGNATLTTSSLPPGTQTIIAIYSGDIAYPSSDASLSQTVEQAASSTSLTSSASSTQPGQAVTFTATVSGGYGSSGTPTGTMTFLDGTTTLGTATLDANGNAAFTTSTLALGSHDIIAVYGGDTSFAGSSATLTQTIGQYVTSMSLTSNAQPYMTVPPGQPVTFTASVNAGYGLSVTPTGTVTFLDGGTTLGTATLDANGTATFTTSTLVLGSHDIIAVYGGDSSFAGSSAAMTQTIGLISTDTISDFSFTLDGQVLTCTAQVFPYFGSSGAPPPTGTVTFLDGTATLGTATLDANGNATFTTSSNIENYYNDLFTAIYDGDSTHVASSGAWATWEFYSRDTMEVSSSAYTSPVGQPVTFTATVTVPYGSVTPTGTVTFLDGTTVLGAAGLAPVNGSPNLGSAAFTTSSLAFGPHNIITIYSGDANYNEYPAGLIQTVGPTGTSITSFTSSALSLQPGQVVTFMATVSPVGGSSSLPAPTGSVTFLDGTTVLGTATLDANGNATFTTSALTLGFHDILAVYSGDGINYYGSASPASLTEMVSQVGTSTSLTSSASSSLTGQAVTFTATVSGTNGTPTGSVTFLDGTSVLGTATLDANGNAAFTTSDLTLGSHDIIAVYSGDSNNAGSSSALTQLVAWCQTTTSLSSSANPSQVGQPVTFTATVTPVGSVTPTPTGTVDFYDGTTLLGTGTLMWVNGQWQATFTTSGLALGAHDIVAVYSGDSNFADSKSSLEEDITD